MDKPNSALWPRIAVAVFIFNAVSHLALYTTGQPHTSHFFNIIFIGLVTIHYFIELGMIRAERQSRWIAILLVTTYVLTMDLPLNHITMALANLLYLEPFWSRAWTRPTSQT